MAFAQILLVEATLRARAATRLVGPATLAVATEVATASAVATPATTVTVSAASATVAATVSAAVAEVQEVLGWGWGDRSGKLLEQFARWAYFAEDSVSVGAAKKIF